MVFIFSLFEINLGRSPCCTG